MELNEWLSSNFPSTNIESKPPIQLEPNKWKEIRLFISSTFVETHAERDTLIKRVIPTINRKFANNLIRVVPVDLRWGVLAEESKDCYSIQKTCLNQLNKCRESSNESPWFLALRTDRYGWVQDKVMPSDGFEQPDACKWIDKFSAYGKEVSITSLECIHATLPPKAGRPSPVVFYYKRNIVNREDIEEDLRWVFDFEYVPENEVLDPAVQYQYIKTNKTDEYKRDQINIDEYAKSRDYVRCHTYNCRYNKGDAKYTCKNEGRKSYAIGFVSDLEDFANQVECDLTEAIMQNYVVADMKDVPIYLRVNSEHESIVERRADTMIGRSDMIETCYKHCSDESVSNSLLIIHGEPGTGKSTIVSAVANRCIKEIRSKGDFVFVHAVDSCPGSNSLVNMLKRLQENIRHYRKANGEVELTTNCPTTYADLKCQHMWLLIESAKNHPQKKFIILVDAVNQFHETLYCWKMWWLPSEDVPKNLRFIISTLNEENGTFENACIVCPNAKKVPVPIMSYEERQEMVTALLQHYNKKLTTTDDRFLGNQMKILLGKNESPLYLIAASEALRQFGVFEKVTEYLQSLPDILSALFNSLLQEWSEEYGKEFIQDLTGFLSIAKDGLLENEINDLLSFKESADGKDYDCSFSRLYDALSNFLAAGGGGFLRFFHDQLKKEVRKKYLTDDLENELNSSLVKFYMNCIKTQLVETPTEKPPPYYQHCLKQIVYHQMLVRPRKKVDFMNTLRNIHFVRERIIFGQVDTLQEEYASALKNTPKPALREWERFVRLYSEHIKSHPEYAYSIAASQPANSHVAKDTKQFPVPDVPDLFPLYWKNPIEDEKYILTKYTGDMTSCCAIKTGSQNLLCIATWPKVSLYDIDTSALIHHVSTKDVQSIFFSNKYKTFWTGNKHGCSIWTIDTGSLDWRINVKIDDKAEIIWIEQTADYIAFGTGNRSNKNTKGNLFLVDEENQKILRNWSTEEESTFSYCYHAQRFLILSGHDNCIKCWLLDGCLVNTISTLYEESCALVSCMNIHPNPKEEKVIIALRDKNIGDCVAMEYDFADESLELRIEDIGTSVNYDKKGQRLIASYGDRNDENLVGVFDKEDGKLHNLFKGHAGKISSIIVLPTTGHLITTAGDGCLLFDIGTVPEVKRPVNKQKTTNKPNNKKGGKNKKASNGKNRAGTSKNNEVSTSHAPDSKVVRKYNEALKEKAEKVITTWACFIQNGSHYVTNAGGHLQVWNSLSDELVKDFKDSFLIKAALYPNEQYLLQYSYYDLTWINCSTFKVENKYNILPVTMNHCITDVLVSPDSSYCVVKTSFGQLHVLDIKAISNVSSVGQIDGNQKRSFDIHKNNEQIIVSMSGDSTYIYNLKTLERESTLKDKCFWVVKYLYNPERIFYVDDTHFGHIMDTNGNNLMTFDENTFRLKNGTNFRFEYQFLKNDTQLLSAHGYDKTLRLHDVETGVMLGVFYEHCSTGFSHVTIDPHCRMVLAVNNNGAVYKLHNSQNLKKK